jgi:hypothetical protein
MSSIAAGTTSGTALVSTGDTAGTLVFQTNGTTTAVTIATNQVVTLAQPLPVGSGGTGATSLSGITIGTATNLAGGSNGTIPYQSAAGTTQMLAAGTSGYLLQSNGVAAPTWVAAPTGGFTLGTPVATTSGTSIDFTGIPSGTKQIIITFKGVSTNGTDPKYIQIGDSGGIEDTAYSSTSAAITETNTVFAVSATDAFRIQSIVAADLINGSVTLTLENSSTFTWVASGVLENSTSTSRMFFTAGRKSLSAVLDRVRLTTLNGTNTFDAGEVNIAYI